MEQRLRALMALVFGLDQAAITSDASIHTIAAWDSLSQLSLIVALEDEFGVSFDEGQISELLTYQSIRDALEGLR